MFLIPAKSQKIQLKTRQVFSRLHAFCFTLSFLNYFFILKETDYIKKITTLAKQIENNSYNEDRFNVDADLSSDDENSDLNEDRPEREATNASIFSRSRDRVHPRRHDETNA